MTLRRPALRSRVKSAVLEVACGLLRAGITPTSTRVAHYLSAWCVSETFLDTLLGELVAEGKIPAYGRRAGPAPPRVRRVERPAPQPHPQAGLTGATEAEQREIQQRIAQVRAAKAVRGETGRQASTSYRDPRRNR
jgi:hypothetical protein